MNWFCVHTKPGKELLVEHYLRDELKLEPYFPRLQRKKTIRRVKRIVTEPLFQRYLFCRFDLATSYRAVRYGQDVIGIVSRGDQPTVVSEATIQQLKDWAGKENDILVLEPDSIAAGSTVKITAGPMQGLEALFLEETSQGERVTILLNLMNTETRTEIDRSQIEPVSQ
jgi:transcriptional antiterminator RfaH